MNIKSSSVRPENEIRRASYVSVIVIIVLIAFCCSGFIVYQSLSLTTLHEEASLLKAKYHCYESNITKQDCDDCIERLKLFLYNYIQVVSIPDVISLQVYYH